MQIFCVGGTFDEAGGRPSGYFAKLASALCAASPRSAVYVLNGGHYAALQTALDAREGVPHLLWFADVPNTLPKLLPSLKARHPGLVLVASKNNRRELYTREALFERMRNSRSELLVEFGEGPNGLLVASVLAVHGEVLLESSANIREVAECLTNQFARLQQLQFPLKKQASRTQDATSYQHVNLELATEIPLAGHPGAFGTVRSKHIHEGVDLYGESQEPVYALEAGVVVGRLPFTGPAAGSPWWAETECLLVEGASGVLNYGEILSLVDLGVGDVVQAGQQIGELATVLLEDKGRPRTMLHLERYMHGTREPLKEWALGTAQPPGLCDPSVLLLQAAQVSPSKDPQ